MDTIKYRYYIVFNINENSIYKYKRIFYCAPHSASRQLSENASAAVLKGCPS